MPVINVAKRFMLRMSDKAPLVEYLVGRYDVTDEIAGHWYVQAHLEGFEPPPPMRGTTQFAQHALEVAQAVRMAEPVSEQKQQPAPPPPAVSANMPSLGAGEVPEGAVYFAGKPQPEQPAQVAFARPKK